MKTPVWIVKAVQPQPDYSLIITFANGEKRIYDASPLLKENIYAQLRSKAFFLRARADCGTVVWSDEVDIAPEHLYECSMPYNN